MRAFVLAPALLALVGCVGAPNATPNVPPGTISCQPYGNTPAPVMFSSPPGPVASSLAEETAVALFRACSGGTVFTEITSGSEAATGMRTGPNEGQKVWLVHVDGTFFEPSGRMNVTTHFLIEVNQATGVPTLIGIG